MKTSELSGAALDWAVARCEGLLVWVDTPVRLPNGSEYNPSTDWAQGGAIIEREKIGFWAYTLDEEGNENPGWYAETFEGYFQTGATPLIAAMRCFVSSRLGDEVELPEELK